MTVLHNFSVSTLYLALAKLRQSDFQQDPLPTLRPPRIPQSEANGGIGYKDIFESSTPLSLFVPTYSQIKVFDTIDVFWEGIPVATVMVKPEDLEAPGIIISVPVAAIRDGAAVVDYLVTSALGGNLYKSHPLNIRVKTNVPGDIDPVPSTPVNENLIPVTGVPAIVDEDNIESIEAVIAVYLNMTAGDRVRLSWGGEFVTHTVEDHEVGRALHVPIPPSSIERVGVGMKVIEYEIRDVVNNWSKWSETFEVDVQYARVLLEPPTALDVADGKLDLALLGNADARVNAFDASMQNGETVHLFWTIYPVVGDPIEHDYVAYVGGPGSAVEFLVPNLIAKDSASSRVALRYELISNSVTQYSRSTTFDVIPEVEEFVPPLLLEAPGVELDLGRIPEQGATAHIPVWLRMAENDLVQLYAFGYDDKGTLFTHFQAVFLSPADVGNPVQFLIPRAYFNQLAKGRVEIYYSVNGVKSHELKLTVVGEPAVLLDAPSVTDAIEGELDPDELTGGTTVVVGDYVRKARGDKITLFWEGLPGASWSEEKEVVDPSTVVAFDIEYAPYIIGNLNRIVTVSYRVQRAGAGSESSEIVPVLVRRKGGEQFDAPTVMEADPDGTTLNPYKAINGVTVRVAFEMKVTDSISVTYAGENSAALFISKPQPGSAGGTLDFIVPASVIGASQSSKVKIHYAVLRDGQSVVSKTLELEVTRLEDKYLPVPEVLESEAGELNLAILKGDAHVKLQAWPLIGDFQICWIEAQGTLADGKPLQIYLAEAHVVTKDDVQNGLRVILPRNQLDKLAHLSDLTITAKVAFDRNWDESKAHALPRLQIRMLWLKLYLPQVEKESGPGQDQLDMKDFMNQQYVKITVPEYPAMMVGHEADVVWAMGENVYRSGEVVSAVGPLVFNVPRWYLVGVVRADGFTHEVLLNYAVNLPNYGEVFAPLKQHWVACQSAELKAAQYLRATQQVSVTYDNVEDGDTVQVSWEGVKLRQTNFQSVVNGKPNLFVMDRLWVTENIGKKVVVNYTIKRIAGGEEILFSKNLHLQF